MIVVILIIAVIILAIENNNLRKELAKLYKIQKRNYCPHCGKGLNTSSKPVINQNVHEPASNKSTVIVEKNVPASTYIKEEKKKMTDSEIKNNTILITGSILIILSAVIFLTSSWATSSNILKCSIIFIMFIVFILASYLAKNIFKLNQTAKAFEYIALAYLPLSLMSLSIFGLIGDTLSINGELQNLYFSITMIISSIIYLAESIKSKDKVLSLATVITSILGMILLSNALFSSFVITLIFLFLYSYFLALLYDNKKYIYSEKFTNKTIDILNCILILTTLFISTTNFFSASFNDRIQNLILLVMVIGLCIYKTKESKTKTTIISTISIMLMFCILSTIIDTNYLLKQIIIMSSIPMIYIYNILFNKKVHITAYILSTTVMFIELMYSVAHINELSLSITLVLFIYSIISIITFVLEKELRNALEYIIPILLEITCISLTIQYELKINILLTLSTLLLATSLIKEIRKYSTGLILMPSIFNIVFISLNYSEKSIITVLLILISIIIYYLLFKKSNEFFKYFMYIFINIGMIYVGKMLCNGLEAYTIALSVIIIMSLEFINEKFVNNENFIFILFNYLVAAVYLFTIDKRTAFLMTIIISVILLVYLYDNKKNKFLYYIPLLTPILYIISSNILVINSFNYMILFNIAISLLIPLSVLKNKDNQKLTPLAYIYAGSGLLMTVNEYIPIMLLLVISIFYLLISNKKNMFKLLTMISTLLLYYKAIGDLNIKYTIFNLGILIIYFLYITRSMYKDKMKEYKPVEYIFYALINIIAVILYVNEIDGMIYVTLLLALTIYSYIRKIGPLFIISLISIVVNIFLLTRLFWLSIPWWIYILLVGIILVVFAINNEINEKISIKDKFKNIKNKLEL